MTAPHRLGRWQAGWLRGDVRGKELERWVTCVRLCPARGCGVGV